MKQYSCAICNKRDKSFSGLRSEVRKHLRVEHRIPGKSKNADGKKVPSRITRNMIVEDVA